VEYVPATMDGQANTVHAERRMNGGVAQATTMVRVVAKDLVAVANVTATIPRILKD